MEPQAEGGAAVKTKANPAAKTHVMRDPGAGYRRVEVGELLADGDEYFNPHLDVWVKTGARGYKVGDNGESYSNYRRMV
jgi:hypothetical protein